MHKNEEFYPFYLKLKADMKARFPEDRKAKVNGKAINRLATFLLKRVYNDLTVESENKLESVFPINSVVGELP